MKEIPEYNGRYLISTDGEIYSNFSKKMLILATDKYGYPIVNISYMGTRKTKKIHRLVAATYLENPFSKPQVNHIDGDKKNNHVSNLEWCTASENVRHSLAMGLQVPARGEASGTCKLTNEKVLEIRRLRAGGMTQQAIADMFEVNREAIGKIVRRVRWKHI